LEQYRQGDVLIVKARKPCGELRAVEPENGRVILAYGEATGHSHSVAADAAQLLEAPNGRRYLLVTQPTELVHQEHGHIRLGAGYYEVVRQREYSPEAIRNVAD